MKNYLFFLTLIISIISSICQAQDSLTVNICGFDKKISFKEDSVKKSDNINLIDLKFLPPIKKSDAITEIRIYNESGNWGNINIYKFYLDSVKVLNFRLLSIAYNKETDKVLIPDYQFIGSTKQKSIFIRRTSEHLISEKKLLVIY